jgi:enoyl-CoA hydratase/carnithine racemase
MSDRIDAETAHSIGLVEHLAEPDRLLDTARDYVTRLAETSAPAAIAETKRLVYRHLGSNYTEALREAEISQNRFVASADAREGAAALLEKRAPNFKRLGVE